MIVTISILADIEEDGCSPSKVCTTFSQSLHLPKSGLCKLFRFNLKT